MLTVDIHTHILPRDLPRWADRFGYGGFVELAREAPGDGRPRGMAIHGRQRPGQNPAYRPSGINHLTLLMNTPTGTRIPSGATTHMIRGAVAPDIAPVSVGWPRELTSPVKVDL